MTEDPLHCALTEFMEHPSAIWLMEEMWRSDSTVSKLLLRHRDELFLTPEDILHSEIPGFSDIRFPFFLAVGSPKIDETMVYNPFENEDIKETDEEEDEYQFIDDEVALLFLHGFILLARKNPSLIHLITEPDYDYEHLLKSTRGMKDLDTEVIADELMNLGDDSEQFTFKPTPEDSRTAYEIKKQIHSYAQSIATDEMGLGRMITQIASYIGPLHRVGSEYLSLYLNRIGLTLEDYQSAVIDLMNRSLVENYGWGLVCSDCEPFQSINFGVESSFNHMDVEMNCPQCGTKMDWCLLVRLCDQLRQALWYRDGLIAIALAWYLKTNGINFSSCVPISDSECDLTIEYNEKSYAIELKMLWHPEIEKQTSEFSRAIKQISNLIKNGDYIPAIIHNSTVSRPLIIDSTTSTKHPIVILPFLQISRILQDDAA